MEQPRMASRNPSGMGVLFGCAALMSGVLLLDHAFPR